jgi:SHS2 domain-containing protein
MGADPDRWRPEDRAEFYSELDHPADVLIEVWGRDLPALFEKALFALYDQLAELEGFEMTRTETIAVRASTPADALRSLLSEALYRFDTGRFVAARADIDVQTVVADELEVTAVLHGETVDHQRHVLHTEVKAVTYHQLAVEAAPEGGWRATVLFDV